MRRPQWMRVGILIAAMALAVTACGGGGDDSASGGSGGGSGQSGNFVIGVSNTLAGNGWREQMICSVKAQALASGKVSKVIAISKNGGPTEQIQDLQNLISQGVNAIIVNPSDREKLNPVIQQATQKKIVVVAVDQAVSEPTAYVATNDQVAYGRLGAQWLADKLGGKGNVLYMRGIDGVPADSDRDKGFQEVMAKNPDIKVKEVFTGWDFTKGGDIAVQELNSGELRRHLDLGHRLHRGQRVQDRRQGPGPGRRGRQQPVHPAAAGRHPGGGRHQPGRHRRGRHRDRPGRPPGQAGGARDPAHPRGLGRRHEQVDPGGQQLPRPRRHLLGAVSVKPYTTYTNEQLFACKGPGE